MQRSYPMIRSDKFSVRLPVRLGNTDPLRRHEQRPGAGLWNRANFSLEPSFLRSSP